MDPNFILVDSKHLVTSIMTVLREYEKDFSSAMPGSTLYRRSDRGLSNPILRLISKISEQHLRDLDFCFSALEELGLSSKSNNLSFEILDGHKFCIFPEGPADRDDLNFLMFLLRKFFENRKPLIKNFREKVRLSEFGVVDKDRWTVQVNKFFGDVVFKDCIFLPNTSFDYLVSAEKTLKKMDSGGKAKRDRVAVTVEKEFFDFCHQFYFQLSERCDIIQFSNHNDNTEFSSTSAKGIAFEVECSDILTGRGWIVEFTPVSGDQGADLIITRGALKMVLQCKNFASPVGNDAVQQAFAAKQYFDASLSAVVSKSGYTNSASELARSTGVLLLAPSDLSEL